jgi:hypothetical protein
MDANQLKGDAYQPYAVKCKTIKQWVGLTGVSRHLFVLFCQQTLKQHVSVENALRLSSVLILKIMIRSLYNFYTVLSLFAVLHVRSAWEIEVCQRVFCML